MKFYIEEVYDQNNKQRIKEEIEQRLERAVNFIIIDKYTVPLVYLDNIDELIKQSKLVRAVRSSLYYDYKDKIKFKYNPSSSSKMIRVPLSNLILADELDIITNFRKSSFHDNGCDYLELEC